ncbi:MAG: hypothetical protein KAV87_16085 [Desulfobacteraceae bacterium]|nr:hypothetical protein [Desulfobacteraceae bacterium]
MQIDQKIITQILDKKQRLPEESHRYNIFSARSKDLSDIVIQIVKSTLIDEKHDQNLDEEVWRYIPIALVANIESYIRRVVADLIDFGPPFSDRAKEFKDIRFRIDSVLSIYEEKVSVGEIIAHVINTSNVSSIFKALTCFIGEGFPGSVQNAGSEYDTDFLSVVSKVFELRHMFCHESLVKEELTLEFLDSAICKCHTFIFAVEKVVLLEKIRIRKSRKV